VGIVSPIVLVAAMVRGPYLWDVPRLTDESNEAFLALLIFQGNLRPLTNVDPYIGALWNYLLAAVFWLTGPSLYAPRLLVFVLGTLTVVPTYLLGRSFGGRWIGAVTAGFLALSPMHVALNSHIAWSNCITPLFTTAALWLTHRAVSTENRSGLVWAGGVWGLALLTHPTAALFLPAVGLYVAISHPRWIVTQWPWLACGAGLLGCSTLVWSNIQSDLAGLNEGLRVQSLYSGGVALDLGVYARRLVAAIFLVSDSLGGGLTELGPLRGPLGLPLGLAFCLLLALGFRFTVRQRNWLPVLAFGVYLLLLPIVNARYAASVPKARYIAPLLPICYVVVGLYLTHLHRQVGVPSGGQQTSGRPGWVAFVSRWLGEAIVVRTVLVMAGVVLLVTPLAGLQTYYLQAIEEGQTNVWFYQTVATINRAQRPGERVYADRALFRVYTASSGQMLDHLRFVGGVYRWSLQVVDLPKGPDDPIRPMKGLLIVASGSESMAAATLRLQAIGGAPPEGARVRVFRVLGTRVAERRRYNRSVEARSRPANGIKVAPTLPNAS
jgi:4-amino-4-deoxy-L-arabinose transferase-like glycosyltransferase